MTTADFREWQAEHAADYDRMGGLVAALAGIALYLAITI